MGCGEILSINPEITFVPPKYFGITYSHIRTFAYQTYSIKIKSDFFRDPLVAQTVKHLPTMQETWVQSPGREGPLEKGMATHSSILAWEIPWMEEAGGLQSMRLQIFGCYKGDLWLSRLIDI